MTNAPNKASSEQRFREIVSGQRRDLVAGFARSALSLAQHPYRWIVNCRNWRYDRGHLPAHRVEVPVISIGNLTVGGTGKTPLVAWIARWFRQHDVRVAVISRGYGSEPGTPNDEARELAQRLPDCPQLQNPDRLRSAEIAIEELQTQLIVLDDGFQHRRLARDLDIVLIDATQPFGFGHVLPRGFLREPVKSLRRAHVVALTRCNLVSEQQRAELRANLNQIAPDLVLVEVAQHVRGLIDTRGREFTVDEVRQAGPIHAFCGIGNPDAFRQTLQELGLQMTGFDAYPDHCHFDNQQVRELDRRLANDRSSQAVLCTHKDLVKITSDRLGGKPLYAVQLDLEITAGLPALESKLAAVLSDLPADSFD